MPTPTVRAVRRGALLGLITALTVACSRTPRASDGCPESMETGRGHTCTPDGKVCNIGPAGMGQTLVCMEGHWSDPTSIVPTGAN